MRVPPPRSHHVEHDQVRPVPLGGLDRLGAAGRGDHVEARVAQARREELEDVRLILDDQQPRVSLLPCIGARHAHDPIMTSHPGRKLNARCESPCVSLA
jgi:hypothetical protein